MDVEPTTAAEPAGTDLPVAPVRRVAKRGLPEEAQFAPEAVDHLVRHVEAELKALGIAAFNFARLEGRVRVRVDDVERALGAKRTDARATKVRTGAGSYEATALARANIRLKKLGQKPELLGNGGFTPGVDEE